MGPKIDVLLGVLFYIRAFSILTISGLGPFRKYKTTNPLAWCPEGPFEGLPEGQSLGPCFVSSIGGKPSVGDGIPAGRRPTAQYLQWKQTTTIRQLPCHYHLPCHKIFDKQGEFLSDVLIQIEICILFRSCISTPLQLSGISFKTWLSIQFNFRISLHVT